MVSVMSTSEPFTIFRLRALLPELAPAERRVAQQVLDDPAAVAGSTIGELAAACGTSLTTVLRFCRSLGFGGYPAFRLALVAELGRTERPDGVVMTGDIAPDDDLDTVVRKVAFADARAVEETAEQLDLAALHGVIDALVAAGRIDVYGVGASGFVALDFQQKLHRIGRVVFGWTDTHMALTSAALLGPGDVAVGISHSGVTQDTLDALATAKRAGATTVALTNFPRSPLAELADLVLTTAARETTFRSGATASRLAQLTVIDSVFVGVAQRTYDTTQRALALTRDAVADRRARSAPRRRTAP